MLFLSHKRSSLHSHLKKFGLAITARPPFFIPENQIIFLCGANKSVNVPSARREAIKKFIEQISPKSKVIYAEKVFNELSNFGGNKNVLDLEHEISEIADKIIIVLESESAFCELGAFAHPALRKKLVVINNKKFHGSASFINVGPLAALNEIKAPVIWYDMAPDGISNLDSVGSVFPELNKVIVESDHSIRSKIEYPANVAELKASKYFLYLVHDFVYLFGPISHKELIDVLKITFGDHSYDVIKRLLSILRALGLIFSLGEKENRFYKSVSGSLFLKHRFHMGPLIASFRRYHMLNNVDRFHYE